MRGQRVYDWWADHQRLFHALATLTFGGREWELRERAIETLAPQEREQILDLACGPGVNFDALAPAAVVGLDYSAGMVRRARETAATLDEPRPRVVRGDAGRLPFPDGSFDAVYSTLAMTAMPDLDAAIEESYRVLAPGGRFVVLDAQPVQEGPGRLLNPLLNPISRWATDWHPEYDVPGALDARFDRCETKLFNSGSFFISEARKVVR
ncbi:class I SAM-dependent methyltransferase [Natronomonas sp. EA1]|uniref:class I SAM-dependent methyltransferase n=1 Tax=Natronomonas sp. EA1 TaxID=3421655 RepID=UPI003EBC130C